MDAVVFFAVLLAAALHAAWNAPLEKLDLAKVAFTTAMLAGAVLLRVAR